MEATRKAPQGYRLCKGRLRAPTRDTFAYAKRLRENCARTFFFFYGAAEVDEEELEEPVLDDEGWARRLWVWRFFLVAALRNLELAKDKSGNKAENDHIHTVEYPTI